jgi:hypothetical protein
VRKPVILGASGVRVMPVEDIFLGYYETTLRAFFVWAESNSPQEDSQKGGVERVFGV